MPKRSGYSLLLIFLFFFPAIKGQDKMVPDTLDSRSFEMGEVLIRPGTSSKQVLNIVESIPAGLINQSASNSIPGLLRSFSSVDLRQRGPFGMQSDIGILGGSFDQTMVLINGINFTDPQTGHNNLSLPFDTEVVHRIDVMTGPSAISYGSNALAGAINFVTGSSGTGKVHSSLTLGAYGLARIFTALSDTSGRMRNMVSFSAAGSGGYRENTDFREGKIFLRTEYLHKRGISDIQAGFTSKDFGANSFYSLRFPEQFEALRTGFLSLRYQSNTKINFKSAAYLRTNKDRFELVRNNDSIPFNHHRTMVAGINLNISTAHTLGLTSIGINLRDERILSNVLGNPVEKSRGLYNKSYSRLITDINAEHVLTLNMLTIKAAVLGNYNHSHGGMGIYPGIHSEVNLSKNSKIFASAGKSLRSPTFTDMFYRSPVQSGNKALRAETATLYEAGIKTGNNILTGNASVFRRRVDNMIDWVKDQSPDSIIWRSMNHSNLVFNGFRFAVSYNPSGSPDNGNISLSYSFLDAGSSSTMLSKYAFDYVRHHLTSGFVTNTILGIYASATITFRDRNNYYQDASGMIKPYKPFGLCDIKLYRQIGSCTFHLEATNIFSTEYFDYGGIPQPGIWVSGGAILKL